MCLGIIKGGKGNSVFGGLYLGQYLVNFHNKGQFWIAQELQITKPTLILKFDQLLMEIKPFKHLS